MEEGVGGLSLEIAVKGGCPVPMHLLSHATMYTFQRTSASTGAKSAC